MYEKHIEVLTHLAGRGWDDASAAAFDAAIELMRAAEPQDADAERVHCETMADAIVLEKSLQCRSDIRAALMRERAQARAEGFAAACAMNNDTLAKQQAKLKAARAEIERLQSAWERYLAEERDIVCSLKTKLVNLRAAALRVQRDTSDPDAALWLSEAIEASKK